MNGPLRNYFKTTTTLAWNWLTSWRFVPSSAYYLWDAFPTRGFWHAIGGLLGLLILIAAPLLFWLTPLVAIFRVQHSPRPREAEAEDHS